MKNLGIVDGINYLFKQVKSLTKTVKKVEETYQLPEWQSFAPPVSSMVKTGTTVKYPTGEEFESYKISGMTQLGGSSNYWNYLGTIILNSDSFGILPYATTGSVIIGDMNNICYQVSPLANKALVWDETNNQSIEVTKLFINNLTWDNTETNTRYIDMALVAYTDIADITFGAQVYFQYEFLVLKGTQIEFIYD